MFEGLVLIGFLSATVRLAIPVLLASTGELFAERSGVLNIGIEGAMLSGAFAGVMFSQLTGSILIGFSGAIVAGALIGFIHAFASITARANQIVSGIAINFFVLGLTSFLLRSLYGINASSLSLPRLDPIVVPALSALPILGPVLFKQDIVFYISIAITVISFLIISRSTLGLWIRSAGENPKACDVSGLNIFAIRYTCVVMSGAMGAMGGAYLSLGQLSMFFDNMVAGRGFIAIAIVILGRWNPLGALIGSVLFGAADALQMRLQTMTIGIPYQFLLMIPYIATIVVLLFGKTKTPAYLTKPYSREE
jgi:ABC-type uncharacterized transport system permease subunit